MIRPGSAVAGRLVYRDGSSLQERAALGAKLREALAGWAASPDAGTSMTLLIRAGAVESALADAADEAAGPCGRLTDLAASALLGAPVPRAALERSASIVMTALVTGAPLRISPPEGLAYYALDPVQFAAAAQAAMAGRRYVSVIGIRTVGVTLAAVAAGALSQHGATVCRVSVRPEGHPFDRRVALGAAERRALADMAGGGAAFLVVDEGPGLSGSSFLATADALVACGIGADRICLLGSRPEDGAGLCAPHAAERWARYRFVAVSGAPRAPHGAARDISGGGWRSLWLRAGRRWPAVWAQTERVKLVDGDGRRWFKFEGFGPFMHEAARRHSEMAAAGFCVPVAAEDASTGFLTWPVVAGTPLQPRDLHARLIDRMAAYLAHRAVALPAAPGAVDLGEMTRANVAAELDVELPDDVLPRPERWVLTDGRMMPHEWLLDVNGRLLKTDAVDHGDDHFYPGPTDPAWDLAGAIVEWSMPASARDALLERYRVLSGDDARQRLPGFLVAYAAFQTSRARLAAASCPRSERWRLMADVRRYRRALRVAVDRVRGISRYCTYLVGDHIRALRSSGG